MWRDVVGGGEGEGESGGDGTSGLLYPTKDGAADGGEEEWDEAGAGR